jgi:hypothetical protein
MPKTSFPAAGEAMPLIEPYAVPDTFASGVAFVEELAPNLFRVVLCAEGRQTYGNERERAVVARLIVTGEALASIAQSAAETLKMQPDAIDVPEHATFN